ncbi:GTPase [Arhodomonas sp. KWT2]
MTSLATVVARWRWLVLAVVLLVVATVLLLAGNQLLALKARLADEPLAVRAVVIAVGLAVLAAAGWGVWRTLRMPARPARDEVVPDEAGLRARAATWAEAGADVAAVRTELDELDRRREAGSVHVAVFGTVSSGKSALIRALAPGAAADSDVLGGTTRDVVHYEWQDVRGDRLVLTDMPGLSDPAAGLDRTATDEAGRADVVVFVAEGDLTREEWRALDAVRALDKPLVVALNKADRYEPSDREAIRARLGERFGASTEIVPVIAGGTETVIIRDSDGHEREEERERLPDVRRLRRVLQRVVDRDGLSAGRDRAVLLLAARKLEGAVQAHRRDAAEALVSRYARRAVVGAMAAVAPGSDLVIQGGLAAGMVRELCTLYEADWREVGVERFIAGVRRRSHTVTPLLLGVAGNALKAFPGVGTLAGGAVHAVAYGLLFRTAGRALIVSLEDRGELAADDALARFEETLREDMGTPARSLARVALDSEAPKRDG